MNSVTIAFVLRRRPRECIHGKRRGQCVMMQEYHTTPAALGRGGGRSRTPVAVQDNIRSRSTAVVDIKVARMRFYLNVANVLQRLQGGLELHFSDISRQVVRFLAPITPRQSEVTGKGVGGKACSRRRQSKHLDLATNHLGSHPPLHKIPVCRQV